MARDGGPRHGLGRWTAAPADAPHLSVFDRGFQLGDGVFETLRASGGRPTELAQHVDRLGRSARGLEIALPDDIGETLAAGIQCSSRPPGSMARWRRLGPDHGQPRGVRRSRGPAAGRIPAAHGRHPGLAGRRGARRPSRDGPAPRDLHRPARSRSPLAALKTTSRAEYVFARLEARRAGADDALFLTIEDRLSEATSANLFLVRGASDGTAELATPSLDCAILAGTTRSWLLGWAERVGLRPMEGHLTRATSPAPTRPSCARASPGSCP